MTCHEFASTVVDLTRPRAGRGLQENVSSREALRHAESCSRCAARLSAERDLSLRLEQVARSTVVPEAASLQEAALRAAFSRRWGGTQEIIEQSGLPAGWRPWTIAIAAMLLATFGGIVARQKVSGWFASKPDSPIATVSRAPTRSELATTTPTQSPIKKRMDARPHIAHGMQPHRIEKSPSSRELPSPLSRGSAVAKAPVESSDPSITPAARDGTASDFVPLLYGGDPMLAESGLIVRVEVSGAMLQTLGFPITAAPSAQRVRADVMLGQDGIARAIRFVQ